MSEPPQDADSPGEGARANDVLREFAPHPYQSLDETGHINTVNRAWLDVLGYERDAVEGEWFGSFLTAESRETFEARFPEFRDAGSVSDVLFEVVRADGRVRTVRFDGSVETDDSGSFVRTHCQFQDVTDRFERERQLETLTSNLPGLVYRCRTERGWPMETVRGRSEELVGYPAERIESGAVSWGADVIHPADREMVWETVTQSVEAGEPFTLTYRIRTRDGTEKWVWEQGRAVTPMGAEATKLEGFITDISERKALQEALRAAKEQYEALFESIRDPILVADMDRRITNCNPAFEALFGYDLADIEGERTAMIYEDEGAFDAMGSAIREHTADAQFTHRATYRKQSGQAFPGETTVSYLRDSDGAVEGFIGVIRDISDREERLRQIKIIDRVLQHNFHNDMNVIEGYADTLRDATDGRLAAHAEKIIETGEDLMETVEKEREITKFLSNPPQSETFDITTWVESTVGDIRERYPGASLSLDAPPACEVVATPAVGQAIEELVENAIVHHDGKEPNVAVAIETTGGTVRVQVADDGPGIPDMERDVLTGDEEIEPLYHGSGLGLWLVTLTVRQADGTVEFDANEPRGSVVTIRLPAA